MQINLIIRHIQLTKPFGNDILDIYTYKIKIQLPILFLSYERVALLQAYIWINFEYYLNKYFKKLFK